MAAGDVAARFELRCLRADELGAWLDLASEVFHIPRPYFARHWSSDLPESKNLAGIAVAVERATGRLVATNRVFTRWFRRGASEPHGDLIVMGGIGEVATHPEFRGGCSCAAGC